ncbi:MAG: hypothetical protein CL846_00430 [Crocinitomicaceae bacterium]|nr:hypothetical protein [Crocinitomicaceae bacterium]|tara:strand:+ start:4292 stop:7750 length:3459 start_codon:yes stop_codon:yes gene_type:complete
MKRFISILLLFISAGILIKINGQIDYQVKIYELYSAADDSDGSGNEDPTWKLRIEDNDGSGWTNSSCYHTSHPYNNWYSVDELLYSRTNCGATVLYTEMECWEEDGCGSNCDYNSGWTCLNNDDGKAPAGSSNGTFGSSGSFLFTIDDPCQWNEYEISIIGEVNNGVPASYKAKVWVNWEPNGGIDPGIISGDQIICSGVNPTQLSSVDDGTAGNATYGGHFSYQWQQDIGCTGAFSDIAGADFQTYSPGALTQSTCFRRKTISNNCSDVFSNSVTITVESPSVAPTLLTPSSSTICAVGTVDLTVSGGSLGTGASWELYSSSCGGTLIASSVTGVFSGINISQTEDFFVLARGNCNTTNCASTTVTLEIPSTAPTSLTATNDTLCSAGDIDFTVVGGSIGTGAIWELFSGSCSGTPITTSSNGTFSNVMISSSETYYVRANGNCNTSTCTSIDILVATNSTSPSEIIVTDTVICDGDFTTLTVNGGTLGTIAEWVWHTDSCNSNSIGTGNSIVVSPSTTTNYFVRSESICGNTNCANDSVIVIPNYIELDSLSVDTIWNPVDSIWEFQDTVCPNTDVDLFAHFVGTLPLNYNITWYEGACGSVIVGVGDSIRVNPDTTTTYFARMIGTCGFSTCKSITIETLPGSIAATYMTASNNNFCTGGSTILTINDGNLGPGAQWTWYEGSCGGPIIGFGSSITVTPSSTTMYYARSTGGGCGTTPCVSILINTYDLNVYQVPYDSLCSSNTLILDGGFPLGGTYSGTGVNNGLFDPLIAGVGSHSITYTYTDGNNCTDAATETIVVLQNNPDPLNINSTAYEICNGNSATIYLDTTNTLIAGRDWVWYENACGTGGILDSTQNDTDSLFIGTDTLLDVDILLVSPSTTTNYYVRSEGGECPPSACIGVTIDVYTLETHVSEFSDICGTATPYYNLDGGSPSGGTYSGSGVTNNIFYPDVAGPGTHEITYTYTLGPCVANDIETISVTESPLTLYSSNEVETCAEGGLMIHIHALNGNGFYNYEWSDGTLGTPLTYAEEGTYSVLVSDANNCYSLLDSITIDSDLKCIEMPNTFTPNSDGLNDNWVLDFSTYESAELIVFNKWGNRVFESLSTTSISWDGNNIEGASLPAATYYYVIKLTPLNGDPIEQTGPITILR